MSRRFRFHPFFRGHLLVNSTTSHHPLDSTNPDLLPLEKKDQGFEVFLTAGQVGMSPHFTTPVRTISAKQCADFNSLAGMDLSRSVRSRTLDSMGEEDFLQEQGSNSIGNRQPPRCLDTVSDVLF